MRILHTGDCQSTCCKSLPLSEGVCSLSQGQTFPLSVSLRAPRTIADITTKPHEIRPQKPPFTRPTRPQQRNRDVTHRCEADDSGSVCGLVLDVWKCEKWLLSECESYTKRTLVSHFLCLLNMFQCWWRSSLTLIQCFNYSGVELGDKQYILTSNIPKKKHKKLNTTLQY